MHQAVAGLLTTVVHTAIAGRTSVLDLSDLGSVITTPGKGGGTATIIGVAATGGTVIGAIGKRLMNARVRLYALQGGGQDAATCSDL